LPTELPSADPPPPRRLRRWLRRFVLLSAALLLILGAVVIYATRHLTTLARWALERAFPGAKVELAAVEFTLPSRLDVKSLVLKSRKTHKVLLSLTGGSLAFNFDDLRRRQIGEVRLVAPIIRASPQLTEAFAPKPGTPTKKTGSPWCVRRLVCDYGELVVTDYGASGLVLSTKFAFDFHNFSPVNFPTEVHSFSLWDLIAATGSDSPFLSLDLLEAGFTFEGLLDTKNLSALSLKGGSLTVGKSLRELFATPRDATAMPQQPWVIDTLDIQRVTVRLDDERPEVSDITFALNTTLKNIPLSQAASALGAEEQIIEVTDLDILSPYDPLTRVFTIESVYFHFTLAGLLRREIADLTIRRPTIHLGPDLFWYMEDIQKRLGTTTTTEKASAAAPAAPAWTIQRLFIFEGELVLGSGGRKQYGIPLGFWANAEDVALDNLASLKANTALEIPPQKYTFDSYQLEFTTEVGGTLKFSYPPEQQKKNLVGDIKLKDIRWRQYRVGQTYVSVTFDKKGINGEFGGNLYRGQAGGGFSFFFDPASPWIGWLWGRKIDLRRLTNVISPDNFQMTGPLNFELRLDAQAKAIDRVVGELQTPQPGKMVIKKLDTMLADIPSTWNLLKQSSTRIALETLRDFSYDRGSGNFWFVRSQGILQLKLQGPTGSRNFDVVLHADDTPQGRWKTRNMTTSE
jgi:hypothetical protein